jgi:hypothetical protein
MLLISNILNERPDYVIAINTTDSKVVVDLSKDLPESITPILLTDFALLPLESFMAGHISLESALTAQLNLQRMTKVILS